MEMASDKKRVRLGEQLERLAADMYPQGSRNEEGLMNKTSTSNQGEALGSQTIFQKLNQFRKNNKGSHSLHNHIPGKAEKKSPGLNLKQAIQAAGKVAVEPTPTGKTEPQVKGARGNSVDAKGCPEVVDKVHMLPMDWSLKNKAVFTSNLPFCSFNGSFTGEPNKGHEAVRSFASGNRRSNDPDQMYRQALLSWVFPLSPLPKGLENSSDRADSKNVIDNRYELWMEAFRDLMYATYQGQCCVFYCLPPEGSPDSFVAFFMSDQVQGRSAVSACLSHSSEGMRRLLRADYDLQFTMPLNKSQISDDNMHSLKSDEHPDCPDGSSQSLILFSGREQVHGLFDFLLNECGKTYHKGCDVPILLSPVPFEGASIKRCLANHRNFKQKSNMSKIAPLGDPKDEELKPSFYQLEIEGIIPPWVVDRLCSTFRRTQVGQFDAHFQPLSTTSNLNVNGVPSKDASGSTSLQRSSSVYGGGFWDTEECEKWFSCPSVTFKRSIVKIHSQNGIFRVTMK